MADRERTWASTLPPAVHARGEMMRRTLPWGAMLSGDKLMARDDEIDRLESVEPTHLSEPQLLELYLLELIEALKIVRGASAS